MNDIIYDLVQTNDLLEMSRILKMIDEDCINQKNRSAFFKNLAQTVFEWTVLGRGDLFAQEKPRYYIHTTNKSIPIYLTSVGLTPANNVRKIKRIINELISDIDKTIVEPSGISLTVDAEERILSVLSCKFPFWKVVPASTTLDIININNTHRSFNSVCGVSGDATTFYIYMFNMKDSNSIPEYVFLHELGHVLQIVLSGSETLVPYEFIEFNKTVLGITLKQGSPEAIEAFADTFSIAVMHDTDFCSYNPFPFPDRLNECFERFFFKLFDKYSASKLTGLF